MKRFHTSARVLLAALTIVGLLGESQVRAQLPTSEERLKFLTDPESVKAKIDKEKEKRPPIEFFRSQIAPFDILPYVKAGHWSTLSLEMRSNYDDYLGMLQTSPVRTLSMSRDGAAILEAPLEVTYRREARLLKEQRARLSLQVMLPRIPKELGLELARPEAIRVDELWQASLRPLEPFQMLVLVLTKETNETYSRWNHLHALIPTEADRLDAPLMDRQRYYRLVLPLDPEHLPLSAHPLTWTSMSHVIWDGMPPEYLSPAQQQAMLDWIHWGGQLILVSGAKTSFNAFRDSFLAPYLPAEPSGENALLNEDDLRPLSQAYRPPVPDSDRLDPIPIPNFDEAGTTYEKLYLPHELIRPASNRPVFLTGLKAREEAGVTQIPLGESSNRILGVEQRVGRGRILMLALNPTDPALAAWPGIDTFVRRVMLRRPEDILASLPGYNGQTMLPPRFSFLSGPDLTWFRLLSRDYGSIGQRFAPSPAPPRSNDPTVDSSQSTADAIPQGGVAEWLDSAPLSVACRNALEEASGISIPSSWFVLKVILAYLITLVPLNWLICRYVFGRREWAWLVVPVLSLGFAIGVERAAAYDMGYDSACDEIDILETYGDYPRAHLSRFASVYSTGRVRYTISYPNDPTAVALPQDNGRSLRGEDIATATWQSQPVPALQGFQVQPRSLAHFRAEQMVNLAGGIVLETGEEGRRIVNSSELELRDAVLVDVNGPENRKETFLGTIAPGTTVAVKPAPASKPLPSGMGKLDPTPFLKKFRESAENRPEAMGEFRLVAWTPKVIGGQKLEPAVDRHRGFTAVVVHLRMGPSPAPDGPSYNYLAQDFSQFRKTQREFLEGLEKEAAESKNNLRMRRAPRTRFMRPTTPPAGSFPQQPAGTATPGS